MTEERNRGLPVHVQAEEATVGSMLVNPTIVEDILDIVAVHDFHIQKYGEIVGYIKKLFEAGTAIDIITLTELGADPITLTQLIARTPSSVNAEDYAHIVVDKSRRRNAIVKASQLAKAAYDETTPIEESVTAISKDINESVQPPHVTKVGEGASELWEVMANYKAGQSIVDIRTPWPQLNRELGGFMKPEFVIVAARPSMGKTQFTLQLIDSLKDKKILFHDLETDKLTLLRRIALMRSKVDWMKFKKGEQNDDDILKLSTSITELMQEDNLYIVDKRMPVNRFAWIARNLARRVGGLDVIVADYVQLYPTSGRSRVTEIGEVAGELKQLAKELNAVVIGTSQLRRLNEQNVDKRPTMQDLRESGELEQSADVILSLYRSSYYKSSMSSDGSGTTEIAVLKSRDGTRGGKVDLFWKSSELTFEGESHVKTTSVSKGTVGGQRTSKAGDEDGEEGVPLFWGGQMEV